MEELKKTTAEEQAKSNKRRMKFQAQVKKKFQVQVFFFSFVIFVKISYLYQRQTKGVELAITSEPYVKGYKGHVR